MNLYLQHTLYRLWSPKTWEVCLRMLQCPIDLLLFCSISLGKSMHRVENSQINISPSILFFLVYWCFLLYSTVMRIKMILETCVLFRVSYFMLLLQRSLMFITMAIVLRSAHSFYRLDVQFCIDLVSISCDSSGVDVFEAGERRSSHFHSFVFVPVGGREQHKAEYCVKYSFNQYSYRGFFL